MTVKRVSVAESKRSLTRLLREVEESQTAVLIYRRDQFAGALLAPEVYESLVRLQAYFEASRLSEELAGVPVNAALWIPAFAGMTAWGDGRDLRMDKVEADSPRQHRRTTSDNLC